MEHNEMPLRDWFAGQALSGLTDGESFNEYVKASPREWAKHMATDAYSIADAMLAERNK